MPQSSLGNALENGVAALSKAAIPNGSDLLDGISNGLVWNILLPANVASEWNLSLLLNAGAALGTAGKLIFIGSLGGKMGAPRGGSIRVAVGSVDWVVGGNGLVLNDCTGEVGVLSAKDFLGLNSSSSSEAPLGLKSSSVRKKIAVSLNNF